ncbi:MAG: hypothetical protein WA183_12440 [Chthoniobacterales bacterium]
MAEEWIVRVRGKEYGPVGVETLQEWRDEGRVLTSNEARRADADLWITAAEIPGLFEPVPAASGPAEIPFRRRNFAQILAETLRIYRKGFFQFFCLTLLVALPSLCAQLSGSALGASPNINMDLRTLIAAVFAFGMLLLSLAAWPAFIAGIQILTAELAGGRKARIFGLLHEALKFWPRVAILCIFVYGAYFFWTLLPLGIILMLATGGPSLISIFLTLLVLAFQVWIIGRLFINFLFWQQFAVLAGSDAASALRQSKKLARSGRDFPWFQRSLWRGVALFSIWSAFVLALTIGPEWSAIRHYFHELTTSQDPQALLQSLTTNYKPQAFNLASFLLGLVQTLLRPLLGIAFVLLYFDSKANFSGEGGD